MNKIIVNKFGGGCSSIYRKGASVKYSLFSDDLQERRSEVRLIGGDSYGK